MARRVVITGIGLLCGVGNTTQEVWANLLAGKSGVGPITHFDASTFPTRFAAQVKGYDFRQFVKRLDMHAGVGLNTQFALGAAAQEKQVEVRLEGADDWPAVTADADQLQQVFLNLVQNAVQATAPGGRVLLRASKLAGEGPPRVMIEVEDSGAGIAAEHLPRIFDPFFTTRPTGTGLGLFVAHGIVQRHGGTIEAESEPGKGTRFRVTLPVEPSWATENA